LNILKWHYPLNLTCINISFANASLKIIVWKL